MNNNTMNNTMNSMKMDGKAARNILLFTLLVNALAWLGPVLGGSPSEPGVGLLVWGSAPLVAALMMKILGRDMVRLGLRPQIGKPGTGRFYLLSLLLYPFAIGLTLGIGQVVGATSRVAMPMGELIMALLPLTVIYFVFAFFEEVGWRGYLVPQMYRVNDGLLGHALVGLIWASWHLPYMSELWAHANAGWATLLPRFIIGSMISAVVYGEIRLRTGSVWPAVLMHWVGNLIANGLLTTVVVLTPGSEWLGSPGVEGALMMGLFAVVGGLLYQARRRHGSQPASAALSRAQNQAQNQAT